MILDDLLAVIRNRQINPQPGSYISGLQTKGKDEILKKIGEEASEVIIASKNSNREEVIHEIADLWFHCMVLMHQENLSHDDIFRELEIRFQKRREGDE